ncbi:putative T7SS-secreted protein [Streptomyces sp. NPDC050147]|uniref:putative T7SS-secreted protein n=1 Tax=Streptomyces sp. NPDC050147 TaxID=3155513 RepID=UPI0034443B5A
MTKTDTATYPDLGFNPAPGDCDTVKELRKKLENCVTVLRDTRKVVTKLMDGSYWEGDAAVAFRETIDSGPLTLNLKNAARSIEKAAKQLDRWEGDLEDYQRRAKALDGKAKDAREALKAAQGHADTAGDDPDLEKKGSKQDDAKKSLKLANGKVEDAQAELDRILGRARSLEHEHSERSHHRAEKIRDATEKLAPHEPGWLEKSWEWVTDNLPNILSAVAGALALAALIFTGPIALPLLLVGAAVFSGAALGIRLSDPAVRASLADGFTKGEFDADFFGNLVSVGADILGAVPGVGVVAKGAVGLTRATRTGGTALSLGQKMATFGSKASEGARGMSNVANPLLERVFRGTSNPAVVVDSVAKGSAGIGLVTAGYGLASEDEIKGQVGTGIDGARLGIDLPAAPGLLRAAF